MLLDPPRTSDAGPALDLTPIIDLVFMLLIFFLVASSFAIEERETKIALPTTSAAQPMSAAMREIAIDVDVDGAAVVAGRRLDDDDLAALLSEAVARTPTQRVSIRGDKATAYANVARVLDICKKSGITEPFLSSIPRR